MCLKELRDEFLYDCECRHLAKGSLRNYRASTRFLLEFLERKQITELEDVRPRHLRDLMKEKQDAGNTPRYINDLLKVWRTWFNYLVEEGYMEERDNPAKKVKPLRQPRTIIDTFTAAEMKRMIQFYDGKDFLEVRNKTIIMLLFDTGMRCNEMILMEPEDIKPDYILVKHGKGGKERVVPKSPALSKQLIKYCALRDAMIAFYVSLGISTYLGSSEYKSYIVYFVQALTATLFVEVALKRKKIEAVVIIRNVLFFFLLINLITLILFSQGLGVYGYNKSSDNYYYFLGLRIAFTPFILTELLSSHIVDYLQGKKLSSFTRMSFAVGLLTLFIEKIATGLLAIAIIYTLMFLIRRKNIKLNMYAIYLIYAIGFILIVVYNIQYKLPFFSYLLEDVMHKDLSFDNRTTIWASTIAAFLKQPLFGYGVTGGGGVLVEFKYRVATLSAHNQILNTLYEGGIVSFIFFVIMFGVVAEKIKKCFSLKLNRLYSCFLIGYLMIMFTEVQTTKALLFITLSIIVDTDKLIEEN